MRGLLEKGIEESGAARKRSLLGQRLPWLALSSPLAASPPALDLQLFAG